MAISYVGGKQAGAVGASSGTWSTSLTDLTGGSDSAPIEGDVVVITTVVGSNTTATATINTSGYASEVNLTSNDTYDTGLRVYWKAMGASPDTSVSINNAGNTQFATAIDIHVYRGVNTTTPFDVTTTTATGTDTGQPNPPAITPSTAGAWILAAGGASSGSGSSFTSSDLSAFDGGIQSDTYPAFVGAGHYTSWTSGSFNPAAWGGGSTSTSASWAAATMALRPSGVTMVADSGSFTLTGTANSLLRGIVISAAGGTFNLTGTPAGLLYTYRIVASSGTFTLTGTNANLNKGKLLTASQGDFTLTGTANTLRRTYMFPALSGTFALTGTNTGLYKGFVFPAASGPFVLTGTVAGLNKGKLLSAAVGTFNLTGTPNTLTRAAKLVIDSSGAYVITTYDATFGVTETVIVDNPRRSASFFQIRRSSSLPQFRGSRSRRDPYG